jgi:23S rRNA (guanine745-N1)-methyltransferase
MLVCPVCKEKLLTIGKTMKCASGHSYDIAAQGYVNLLLSGKSGDCVGDDPELITARRDFLDAGYYAPLRTAICEKVRLLGEGKNDLRVLDSGCGEGYYTRAIAETMPDAAVYGVDISRYATKIAAGRDKKSRYITASAASLPIANASVDLAASVFAPRFATELRRVLKPDGAALIVVPGRNHLLELKEAVYETAYLNREEKHTLDGFTLESSDRVVYDAHIDNPTHIRRLFAMTPYAVHTPKAGIARLNALAEIGVTLDFLLLTFKL